MKKKNLKGNLYYFHCLVLAQLWNTLSADVKTNDSMAVVLVTRYACNKYASVFWNCKW